MQLPSLEWVNQDSAYLRQLRGGFTWLRFADELEPDMAYYDEEQMSGCGLDDLRHLLLAWRAFVREESGSESRSH